VSPPVIPIARLLIGRKDVTFAEVKRLLACEEHEKVEKGDVMMSLGDSTPGGFIQAGIQLEQQQYVQAILSRHGLIRVTP
jgi:hypothetical protein